MDLEVAFRYASALNYLLENETGASRSETCTVVFWADHPSNVLEDVISAMFSEPLSEPKTQSSKRIKSECGRLHCC